MVGGRQGPRLEVIHDAAHIRGVSDGTMRKDGAYAVIRQLAVECGYTTASISERIYSRSPADGEPMAGVLI